jgi:ribosomal protein S18 acetylase RimI-like enzyme
VPRRRLGVVLLLPPDVAAQVDGLRLACGDPALRRIPPHITLVPPVNVREDDVDAALAVVRDAATTVPSPLELALGPVDTFLPDSPVAYLRVGGRDAPALAGLRERLLAGPLARDTGWPFVAHVTHVDGADEGRLRATETALADVAATIDVVDVHVFEQAPDRVWHPIARAPLGPRGVVGRGGLDVEIVPVPPTRLPLHERMWSVEARRHGRVVGRAAGSVVRPRAVLTFLEVDEALRRMGIGRHLLAAVEQLVAEDGCDEVVSVLFLTRPDVEAALRAAGWREFDGTTTYGRHVNS